MTKRTDNIWGIILFLALVISACAPAVTEPIPTDEPIPVEPDELPLVTQSAPATEVEEALLPGTLSYQDHGCWRVSNDGTSYQVIWPDGFTATAMIGAPQVLDESGDVVGTAGMEISLGGGAREGEAAAAFEEEHPGLPLDQCPGPYWVVGEVLE